MADTPLTPREAASRAIDQDLRLAGEDPKTPYLDDAIHWVSVYTELLAFKDSLLTTTARSLASMNEADAHADAMTDVVLIRTQAERYRRRLDEWTARVRALEEDQTTSTEAV